ncbi:MAG: formylmethanofuran--tetrahydromethanopterin N-formyltransferase, partial [Pseudomonadota bacterium]|nr:formylmethanofuran--tetrahydromethanopterin N-formyltransferase [Pseudomonadota bacterium]
GLDSKDSVNVGGQLKYFGDGYQIRKSFLGRRFWRIPVMDGEFIVDEKFNIQPAVGGGNIILLAKDQGSALVSAQAAVKAMQSLPNIILPFPNGVVRSGSKVGSKKYKTLPASTNHSFCPTLKGFVNDSNLPDKANATLEIVIDGLDLESVEKAMLVGIQAASGENILQISAGNYGGGLGKYKINLNEVLAKQGEG